MIGGGQLGRMFALDAKRMGYDVITLDPHEHSPCGQVADDQIVAAYDDLSAIEELGRRSDVITYEFENIDIGSVRHLEALSYRVLPGSSVLHVTQNRLREKEFVRDAGLATTPFAAVQSLDDLARAAERIGFPAVLKTVRGGYDGKGQWEAASIEQAREAFAQSGGAELIFEAKVSLACELSVIATRNARDELVAYPVAENRHDRGILAMTIAPARVSAATANQATEMAAVVGRRLGIVGTYCVEFFLSTAGELLVNEIAPRPHNSGHYTIDVTPCSQYEQQVRAICDLPLSPPRLLANAVMMNVLGDGTGDRLTGIAELLRDPSIVLHVYGKRHAVARRKMGHFTMLVDGPVDAAAIARAESAHALLELVAMLTGPLGQAFSVFVTLVAMLNPIEAAAAFATLTEGRSTERSGEHRAACVDRRRHHAHRLCFHRRGTAQGARSGDRRLQDRRRVAAAQSWIQHGLRREDRPSDGGRSKGCGSEERSVGLSARDPDHYRPGRVNGERRIGLSHAAEPVSQCRHLCCRRRDRRLHHLSLHARLRTPDHVVWGDRHRRR